MKLFSAIMMALQLGFLIAIPFVLFVALGVWIDTRLETSPLFLLFGIILAFILAVYEQYHLIMPLIRDNEE